MAKFEAFVDANDFKKTIAINPDQVVLVSGWPRSTATIELTNGRVVQVNVGVQDALDRLTT